MLLVHGVIFQVFLSLFFFFFFFFIVPSGQAGGGGSNGDDDLEVFGISMPALSLFIERLSRANLSTVFEDGLVWLHGDGNGRNEDRMERVGDLSPNGAFGQCLVYRVDITELSQVIPQPSSGIQPAKSIRHNPYGPGFGQLQRAGQ